MRASIRVSIRVYRVPLKGFIGLLEFVGFL